MNMNVADMPATKKIAALSERIHEIEKRAEGENRALTTKESGWIAEAMVEIENLRKEIPDSPLSLGKNGPFGGSTRSSGKPYALRNPGDSKKWKDLFGSDGYNWPDRETDFFTALFSGRHHPGLIRAAMTESVPSSGGFLVPVEYAERIHNVALESEIVMPNAFVMPMKSNEVKIPATVIGDHSSNLMGGFSASYVDEAGTISEADPKVRQLTLAAKKLTGLLRITSELASDSGGQDQIVRLCGGGLGWYRDRAFLKGCGAGEPLGILNAGCLVVVPKEAGQSPDSICWENLTRMMSRMYPGSFRNSVWVAHQSTIPQLLSLSISVGTGGAPVPALSESNGQFSILTRPVVFSEKLEVLGDQGDIMLCDFSQYAIGLRSDMRFDFSPHVHFTTDEILARIIERHDGMPLWDEALTLADGTTTVSPFVTLQARA